MARLTDPQVSGDHQPVGAGATTETAPAGATEASPQPGEAAWNGRPRRAAHWLIALLAGLAVAGAAWFGAMSTPQKNRATAYVVVVPSASATVDQAASLFDSLSKGQVIATAAMLLGQSWWPASTEATISAGEVTPSSVIKVAVTSSDADQARSLLSESLRRADQNVGPNIKPYELRPVGGDITVERVGLSLAVRLAVTVLAGLVGAGLVLFVLRRALPRFAGLGRDGRR